MPHDLPYAHVRCFVVTGNKEPLCAGNDGLQQSRAHHLCLRPRIPRSVPQRRAFL